MPPPIHEVVAAVEAADNPSGMDWRDFFLSRFTGALPKAITESPTVLMLEPASVSPGPQGLLAVEGFFEVSTNPMFANLGRILGTLDPASREFLLFDQKPDFPWTFRGHLSPNGRVMHLTLTFEEQTSEPFSLVHEDTAARLIPDT